MEKKDRCPECGADLDRAGRISLMRGKRNSADWPVSEMLCRACGQEWIAKNVQRKQHTHKETT